MPINLSILVFVASPLDYARYRHTALFFDFQDTPASTTSENVTSKKVVDLSDGKIHNGIESSTEKPFSYTNAYGNDELNSDAEITSSIMEVTGTSGLFSFSERVNARIPKSSAGTFLSGKSGF